MTKEEAKLKLQNLMGYQKLYRVDYLYNGDIQKIYVIADLIKIIENLNYEFCSFTKISSCVGEINYGAYKDYRLSKVVLYEDYHNFQWRDEFHIPDDSVKDYRISNIIIPGQSIERLEQVSAFEKVGKGNE